MPVAAAAGAVTFLSPCCLPLVPGYLWYITGMSGVSTDAVTEAELGQYPSDVHLDGPFGQVEIGGDLAV